MILIYDNSNPIIGSLLSAACTVAEFNYGQARFPLLVGTFLSLLEVQPQWPEGVWRPWGGRGRGGEGKTGSLVGSAEWRAATALPAAGSCTA